MMLYEIFGLLAILLGLANLWLAHTANNPPNRMRRGGVFVSNARYQMYGIALLVLGIAAWVVALVGV